ncbi:hypothetical protein AB0I60_35255 [Actinosynnema sp. NPDC050436]|uniref:hypothetical protein n=1 Tax=Actinosynnema sp. NPDC050436 TaxID=3155659 RepID=UPI0033F9ED8E
MVDAAGPATGDGTAPVFAVGDAVIGLRDRRPAATGTRADFVVLDASAVAHAPRSVSAVVASRCRCPGRPRSRR